MTPTPLVVIGAGGFARETAEAVRQLNEVTNTFELRGYLDDDPVLHGCLVDGLPVLGSTSALASMPAAQCVVCVGNPRDPAARHRVVERLGLPEDRFATVVHPTVVLPRDARVGAGSVLLAGVVLTAAVTVGRHVAVMPHVVCTHDDVIEDFATLGAGVRLAGHVRVGAGAYVGSGALVREGLTVGSCALVGMGSVVLHNVPAGQTWAGVPARRLLARERTQGRS